MTKYYQIDEGVLKLYTGREEEITVPEGVHTVGEGAFKGCVSLKKVVLPAGLKSIMGDAFKGCRKLEEIVIPDGVSYIGSYAFHRCHKLKQVILPLSVEELGECAFLYCDSMTEVWLPGVKRLGTQAFANAMSLEKLVVSKEMDEGCICDVFTGCAKVTEISFADGETFHMPNVVEVAVGRLQVPPLIHLVVMDILRMMELDGRCLIRFRVNIKHVEVPEGIEVLAKSCFYDMRGILDVTLPQSLKSIESRAFRNCISLEKVIFGGNRVQVHGDAFKNCTSLKTVRTCDGIEYGFRGLSDIYRTETGEAFPDVDMEGDLDMVSGITQISVSDCPELVRVIRKQVLGNFRISGTMLLKYLGAESRVVIPKGITMIAEEAFAGNEAIDKVILPESLIEIGAEAFRGCLLLQTLLLPEGLCRIGAGAFEDCVKLLRISLPSKVNILEDKVFRHCKALQEITFPEGFQSIGESVFYGCSSLKKVQLPESLTFLGKMAFYRSGLREIRIPARAEYVESLAFAKSNLQKAWVSGGRETGKHYGKDIFGDCARLKTLVLEEGVRHIPDKFAYGCTALERVILPQTLESVGRHSLEGTAFLGQWKKQQAVQFTAGAGNRLEGEASICGNSKYIEREKPLSGDRRHLEGEGPISGNGEYIKPENVIFWDGRHLEGEVRLPGYVRILAGGAFYGNTKVTQVHLPEHIRSVGAAAFKGCKGLRKVYFPSRIKALEAEVFSGCSALEDVIVSDGNMWQLSAAGERHIPLQNAEPQICNAVGGDVYEGDSQQELTEEFLLPLWRSIGERAFYQCKSLRRIQLEQAECIGKEALLGCAALGTGGSSAFNAHLKAGERAFAGTQLGEKLENGLWTAGNLVVSGEACVGEITLPEDIRGIAPYAFSGNCSISKVVLPEKLEWIGEGAFFGCSGLLEIIFPKAPHRIDAHAFEKCISLTEAVSMASQVKEAAFAGCTGLTRVQLPRVIMLGKRLFAVEMVLPDHTVVCFNGLEDREKELPSLAKQAVTDSLNCFKTDEEGVLMECTGNISMLRLAHGITAIGEGAFQDGNLLTEITFPETVKKIGKRAFAGCKWLREVRQADGVESIGERAFSGCGALQYVELSEKLRQIGARSFENCTALEEIRIPEGVEEIPERAFYRCHSLKRIQLPATVKKIGKEAFAFCSALPEIRLPEDVQMGSEPDG